MSPQRVDVRRRRFWLHAVAILSAAVALLLITALDPSAPWHVPGGLGIALAALGATWAAWMVVELAREYRRCR